MTNARHTCITDQRGLRRLRKPAENLIPGTRQPGQCIETRPPRQVVFSINHRTERVFLFQSSLYTCMAMAY